MEIFLRFGSKLENFTCGTSHNSGMKNNSIVSGITNPFPSFSTFSAVYVADGTSRRVTFQAVDMAEAKALADRWGVGVTGEVVAQLEAATESVLPQAYAWKEAARQLGGVSRSQIYTWLVLGHLSRLPRTRRVLITRESLEKMRSLRN